MNKCFKSSIVVVGEIITLNLFFDEDIWTLIIRHQFESGWVGMDSLWLDSAEFEWLALGCVDFGWLGLVLGWIDMYSLWLDLVGLNWLGLGCVYFGWVRLGLGWVGTDSLWLD